MNIILEEKKTEIKNIPERVVILTIILVAGLLVYFNERGNK